MLLLQQDEHDDHDDGHLNMENEIDKATIRTPYF
jgi:hypothetical protein